MDPHNIDADPDTDPRNHIGKTYPDPDPAIGEQCLSFISSVRFSLVYISFSATRIRFLLHYADPDPAK